MSKARNLSDFISDATIDSTEIADLSVTHAKLHTDMNLSSKTLTFAANQISGNSVDGGVISNFASTGIDDNASATAVTILSDGKVGIGTNSPDANLSLKSPIYTSGGTGNGIRFQNQNNNADAVIQSYYSGTSTSALLHGSNSYLSTGASFTAFDNSKASSYVLQNTNGAIEFGNNTSGNPTERMQIDSSGNVGIGVSPSSGIQLKVGNSANNSAVSRVTNGTVSVDLTASSGGKAFLEVGTNHPLVIATNAAERMRIDSSGNVGIGTDNPGRELHVYNATEANIKIQAGSDYAELRVKDSDDRFSMHYNGSQVIALDSNEIFIHKNTSAIGTQGAYFNSNYSHITSTNDSPITLNRLGNNNNLNYALDVRKDSTNAGGISVQDTWNSTKTSSFHPMSSHTYGYGLHGLNLHGYDVGRLDQSNTFDGGNQSGAYMPGITGTSPKNMNYLEMHFQVVADNVYRPFMINMNDVKGVLEIVGGDASSRGYKRWYVNYTSSAYGVYGITEAESVGGGWNSGSFSARVEAPNGALAVGFKFSSYYSSTNVASFKAIWRVI